MKRTIAIVCGGDTSEFEVSLRSAQGIYSFIDKERYTLYIVEMRGTELVRAAPRRNEDSGRPQRLQLPAGRCEGSVRLRLYHYPRHSGRRRTPAGGISICFTSLIPVAGYLPPH